MNGLTSTIQRFLKSNMLLKYNVPQLHHVPVCRHRERNKVPYVKDFANMALPKSASAVSIADYEQLVVSGNATTGIAAHVEVLVSRATESKSHHFAVSELLQAVLVLEPQRLAVAVKQRLHEDALAQQQVQQRQSWTLEHLHHAIMDDIEAMQVQLKGFKQRKLLMSWLHQDPVMLQQMDMTLKSPGLMSVEAEQHVYLAVMNRLSNIRTCNRQLYAGNIRYLRQRAQRNRWCCRMNILLSRDSSLHQHSQKDCHSQQHEQPQCCQQQQAAQQTQQHQHRQQQQLREELSGLQRLDMLMVDPEVCDSSSGKTKGPPLQAALKAHSRLQGLCTEEAQAFKLSLEEEAAFAMRFLQKMAAQLRSTQAQLTVLLQQLQQDQ